MTQTPKFGDPDKLSKNPSVTSLFTFAQRTHRITKVDFMERCNHRFNQKTFMFRTKKRRPEIHIPKQTPRPRVIDLEAEAETEGKQITIESEDQNVKEGVGKEGKGMGKKEAIEEPIINHIKRVYKKREKKRERMAELV